MPLVRPSPGAQRPYRFPAFSRVALANGVEVMVAPFHRLPLATIRVLVEAGATADTPGREGESWLVSKSLIEGTRRFGSDEITMAIERLGGELDPETDWNEISISTTIRADAVGDALALMAELLCAATFPDEGVERNRSEQLAAREQARRDPRQNADDMFARIAYAAGARFATSEAGESPSIAGLTPDSVRAFHATRIAPERTCVIVAGDVDIDDVVARVSELLGSWNAGRSDAFASEIDLPAAGSAVHVVDRPGAPQTELRIGHIGIARLHPDYFAAVVMNSVFGGLFSSRINLNLREKHGFTYGAFSAFDWRVHAGPFMISTAVQTEVTGAAAREVLNEIDRMREQPISGEERSLAVDFLSGVFPIRFETTAAIAAALATARVFCLPDDYFDTYRDCIRAVTVEHVLEVARRHLRPQDLQILALGDATAIDSQLAGLGREVLYME